MGPASAPIHNMDAADAARPDPDAHAAELKVAAFLDEFTAALASERLSDGCRAFLSSYTKATIRGEADPGGPALLRAAVERHGAERVVEELAPFWAIQLDASAEDAAAAVRELVSVSHQVCPTRRG